VFRTESKYCSDIAGTLVNRSDFLLATVSHVVKAARSNLSDTALCNGMICTEIGKESPFAPSTVRHGTMLNSYQLLSL